MKVLVIISIFIYLSHSYESNFSSWKKKYNVKYSDRKTELKRQKIFYENCEFVEFCIDKYKIQYELDMNKFGDMTFKEFRNKYLRTSLPNVKNRGNKVSLLNVDLDIDIGITHEVTVSQIGNYSSTPASVDHRKYSLAVQNQFECGACWAFAAVGVLESRMIALNSSYKVLLSPQYFIDCDLLDFGCVGGWPYTALNWLVFFGENAVPSLDMYPYKAEIDECESTTTIPMNIVATVQNFTAGNEIQMKQIVANIGPVASVVDATHLLQLYSSGIFYDSTCNNICTNVNHAVVIVGYGRNTTSNLDYWIVKNSWGVNWGQRGYFYIARNKGNQCNIACWAIYAI